MFVTAAAQWISQYGYAALAALVFLESAGLPVPGETALLSAAFAAAHGTLSLPVVVLCAAIAGILGDNLGYSLGRRFGRGWLERNGRWIFLSPAGLERMDAFFVRFGPAAVTIARFVTGVRVIAAIAAGAARMPWRRFLLFNAIGAVMWAGTVGGVGYAIGRGYGQFSARVGHAGFVLLVAVGGAALAVWAFRRALRARRSSAELASPARSTLGAAGWTKATLERVGRHALATLTVSAGATLLFAKIAEDVTQRESVQFDAFIRERALALHNRILDRLFEDVTWIGSGVVLIAVCVLAAAALLRYRGRRVTPAVLAAPVVASGAIIGMKHFFHRLRPPGALQHMEPGFSFPSGHTLAATAVLLTTAYVLVREKMAPRWTIAAAATLAFGVGLSRIYLDVHWATDVLGGWSVGFALAAACALLYERARHAEIDGRPASDKPS